MTQTVAEWVQAAERIREAQRIAITSHVNPDADALGSSLGLTLGLRALGKDVVVAMSDPIPGYARFLSGTSDVVTQFPETEFDLFIFADAAGIERVGSVYLADPRRIDTARIVNIDHHHTNPRFGAVNVVDGTASSTSEMVYRLLCELEAPVDANTATVILFGIVGDTGSFRNGATTPGALDTAGRLVALGADIQRIAFQLFEHKTFSAARLWGLVVSTAELDRERGIVFACMSQAMLKQEGGASDETEGIAEYLRGVQEARIAVLLKETEDGTIRVSMRSGPDVDVSAIASALDGGGHRQAAGCTVAGPFSAAKAALTEAHDRLIPR